MQMLHAIDLESATGRSRELLEFVHKRTGRVPNMVRYLANSPAALAAYLDFARALQDCVLPDKTQDLIGVAVAEASSADYALSALCAIARSSGSSAEEIGAARQVKSDDGRTEALLTFAVNLVSHHGHVPSSSVRAVQRAGCTDAEIAETVALVVLNLYRCWFNIVAGTEIDFPVVKSRTQR